MNDNSSAVLSFLNVGYGDSVLIEYKNDKEHYTVLIDGGTGCLWGNNPMRVRPVDYLLKMGCKRIDLLVVTHPHEDHVGGLLDVATQIEIGEMWCVCAIKAEFEVCRLLPAGGESGEKLTNALKIFSRLCALLRNKGCVIKEMNSINRHTELIEGLIAECLWPHEAEAARQRELIERVYCADEAEKVRTIENLDKSLNNASLILKISCCGADILLCADACKEVWEKLYEENSNLRANILKLPHHGNSDGVTPEIVRAISSEFVVCSVSNDREDNCPDSRVFDLFLQNRPETRLLFTDTVKRQPYATGREHEAVKIYIDDVIRCFE